MQLQHIQQKICEIRGMKVMLDFDLAELYDVNTKALNQAVKRNSDRFPLRFMFRLSVTEWLEMRSQIVTASQLKRNTQITPFAFTEHGVTMLASVLRSKKAIQMNIAIVEAFIALKEYALTHKDLTEQLKALEAKYDKKFEDVYEAIGYLLKKEEQPIERKTIGFKKNQS
ncbi:MAG: DNA-binding protein [Chitinophagaceae bacterium]|nr:DNA-binding protein [Chitinophagaceae bacterium]